MTRYIFGIDDLDKLYGDALSPGSMIVVAGHPGAGKTTFASTICYRNALRGSKCLYISVQEDRGKLYRNMKRLGIDFEEIEKKGLLKYIKLPLAVDESIVEAISNTLLNYKPDIVVLDSITAILQPIKDDVKRAWLQNYFYEIGRSVNGIVVLIVEIPYGEEKAELGSVEFVSDAVFILKHRIERGLLNRVMEIRKARAAPITVAEIPFSITQDVGLEVWMPTILEEILPPEAELKPPCRILERALDHIHKGHVMYIEYPADFRVVDHVLMLLGTLSINNLKAIVVSYKYPPETIMDLIERAYSVFGTAVGREAIREFIKKNIVIRSYNPFIYSVYRLFSEELTIIRKTSVDAVVFHGIELPALVESKEVFFPILYNQINALKKQGLLIIRIGSYINEDFHNMFSAVSDIVMRFKHAGPINKEYKYELYIWRRGVNPYTVSYEEFQECLKEICNVIEAKMNAK